MSIPQLHAQAEAVPGRYRALVLMAGYGELRWGELVGLQRRRVDLADARIHVVEQVAEVAGKFIISPPKTAAGQRLVVLPGGGSSRAGGPPGRLRYSRTRGARVPERPGHLPAAE